MLLHETRKVIASQSIAEKEIAQNNSIQSTAIQSKTYLQVLPVILSNDSYSVRTNALLDCGADSTLFREDISKILQLKGKQKPLKIQNAFLDSGQTESQLVNFTISSNHHPQKIQITKAWSIPNLSIPHTSYSTQELQKRYQHLQGIDIPSISSSDITVLIGADIPQLLIYEEYKTGKENEPSQQTFQRRFNVVFRLIWRRDVTQRQINVETLCLSTLKFTTFNNVETTFSISMLNWTMLDNVEATLSFSTSIITTLRNDETRLRIWPLEKKKPRFKNNRIFLSFKEYARLKIFIFVPILAKRNL